MALNSIHPWDEESVADFWKRKDLLMTRNEEYFIDLHTSGSHEEAVQQTINLYRSEEELRLKLWLDFQILRDQTKEEERRFYQPSATPHFCVDWLGIANEQWIRIETTADCLSSHSESFEEMLDETIHLVEECLKEQKRLMHEFNVLHARRRSLRWNRDGY